MSDVTLAALIGAGAAAFGGLLAGLLNIGLEKVRIQSARNDARRIELRDAMMKFFVNDREWRVGWEALEHGEYKKQEAWLYGLAVASREAAYALALLAPDPVFEWWDKDYSPLRDEFEQLAMDFGDGGLTSERQRDEAAQRLFEEISRGRSICRGILHAQSRSRRSLI